MKVKKKEQVGVPNLRNLVITILAAYIVQTSSFLKWISFWVCDIEYILTTLASAFCMSHSVKMYAVRISKTSTVQLLSIQNL
jgi:hypothetical protein